jgi:hypothetical protein
MDPHYPTWGNKYINYIFAVMDIQDWRLRLAAIWEFRNLSGRVSKGTQPSKAAWESATAALHLLNTSTITFDPERVDLVFNVDQIKQQMFDSGHIPAIDAPVAFEDIVIYMDTYDYTPVNEIIELFERIDEFQQLLSSPRTTSVRTIKSWIRKSGRFWSRKNILDGPLDNRFKSLVDLEGRIKLCTTGFCSRSLTEQCELLGPSLILPYRRARILGYISRYSRSLYPSTDGA